jgi:hypothetical protein
MPSACSGQSATIKTIKVQPTGSRIAWSKARLSGNPSQQFTRKINPARPGLRPVARQPVVGDYLTNHPDATRGIRQTRPPLCCGRDSRQYHKATIVVKVVAPIAPAKHVTLGAYPRRGFAKWRDYPHQKGEVSLAIFIFGERSRSRSRSRE